VTPSLEARSLVKRFGALTVTDSLSIGFERGARHAVIGPNGAGKTTLFNLLAGALRPDAGQVLLEGEDVTAAGPDARARTGLSRSFQRNNPFPDMTVAENLETALAIAGGVGRVFWRGFGHYRSLAEKAREIAGSVGLNMVGDTIVRQLSYGMQRQLEIGLALAAAPKVLLLDEPTAGMSPEETEAMRHLIAGLPRSITVVLIEHDMDVVFGIADRITVLDQGRVLLTGAPEEVRDSAIVRERYMGSGG